MKLTIYLRELLLVLGLAGCSPCKPDGMVWIPGGSNSGTNPLGSVISSYGVRAEEYSSFYPDGYALASDGFWMDQTLITIDQWEGVRTQAVSYGYTDLPEISDDRSGNYPAFHISWSDAVKWCNARSEIEGRIPSYYTTSERIVVYRTGQLDIEDDCVIWTGGYRLPTINEWEYAARGGLVGKRFPKGDTITHANANFFSDKNFLSSYDLSVNEGHPEGYPEKPRTTPVKSLSEGKNGYGLYDMAGNLWQWNWEWHPAPPFNESRVLRGGCCAMKASNCKVGFRTRGKPHTDSIYEGFRIVLAINE